MVDIVVKGIDISNVDKVESESLATTAEQLVKQIVEADPTLDKLYVISVNCDGMAVTEMFENMHALKNMFDARGVTNAIYVPNNTVKISEVKVVHEYAENKSL